MLITKSISNILHQTLCIFSQTRYMKHIKRHFFLSPGTCPRGRTWGVTGGLRFKNILLLKFNQIWCSSYSHECDVQRHTFLVPALWDPGEGPKSQISLNCNYKVNFIFFHQTLCRCKHIRQYFHSVAWVMSQG